MNDWKRTEIKKQIDAMMPQVPEQYTNMIENTIRELKRKDDVVTGNVPETKRHGMRWYGRLAVAMVMLVVVLSGSR